MELKECIDLLYASGSRCVVADENRVLLMSDGRGMGPMLELAEGFETKGWRPLFQADRIIGKAAALIAAHCGIREMYGDVVSESARAVAEQRGIIVSYRNLTPAILNEDRTKEGPFEFALKDVDENNYSAILEIIRAVQKG